ncbi:hypothetical protein GWI33_009448, partial [Rhynchophorus ferrugineus]
HHQDNSCILLSHTSVSDNINVVWEYITVRSNFQQVLLFHYEIQIYFSKG